MIDGSMIDEASIADLHHALTTGQLTAVELTDYYLDRIATIDATTLHSVPVINPHAREEAEASDQRRRNNETKGILDGIPFTIKDNYKVAGLTVAAGSPAFEHLVATADAFTVSQLKQAGAVLLGKTNMPPMADGGMQRGLYGRAESPYNPDYLAAAFGSGSSQGSAVAVAANLCAFSLGTETVSSGRSPASNNSVVTYTPSRGLISLTGVWPLFALRDVVTPYTRTVKDLLPLLDVLTQPDPNTRGDLWRTQQVITLPSQESTRWSDLATHSAHALRGTRIAVPRLYARLYRGEEPEIPIRRSIQDLWHEAAERLRRLGAELIETDFPLIEAYEGTRPAGEQLDRLGFLPEGWLSWEFNELLAYGWDDFLKDNGDPNYPDLAHADPDLIFPTPTNALPDRYDEVEDYEDRYRAVVELAQRGLADPATYPHLQQGLRALEDIRRIYLEQWMDDNGFDLIAFPANADIGPADSDVNPASADITWRNGVVFSHGNYAIRHMGVPTITVPMGITRDIGMPVGLTLAGRAYADRELIRCAWDFESLGSLRRPPNPSSEAVQRGGG